MCGKLLKLLVFLVSAYLWEVSQAVSVPGQSICVGSFSSCSCSWSEHMCGKLLKQLVFLVRAYVWEASQAVRVPGQSICVGSFSSS